MVEREVQSGAPHAESGWDLMYEVRSQPDQDPEIECTIYKDGEHQRALSLGWNHPHSGQPAREFTEKEITTFVSEIGTLVTVQLEESPSHVKRLMVVLPTLQIVPATPDPHTFDHVSAAAIIQEEELHPDIDVPDRPHQRYATYQWFPEEHRGSRALARRH